MNSINLLQPKTFLLLSALVALTGCFEQKHHDEQYNEQTPTSSTINNTEMKEIIAGLSQARIDRIEMGVENNQEIFDILSCDAVDEFITLDDNLETLTAFENNISDIIISNDCHNNEDYQEYRQFVINVIEENQGLLYTKLELASKETIIITRKYPSMSARFVYHEHNKQKINYFKFH